MNSIVKSFEYQGVAVDILKPERRGFFANVKPLYEFHIHLGGLNEPFVGSSNCDTVENSEAEARHIVDYYVKFHPEML